MKIKLESLKQMSLHRPEGYYEDVINHGIVEDNFLEITQEDYGKLLEKYRPQYIGSMRGIGDLVAIPAQAIAHGIDKVFHTNIANCGGCKRRQEKLNAILPFK